jgi:hypothetical protein
MVDCRVHGLLMVTGDRVVEHPLASTTTQEMVEVAIISCVGYNIFVLAV